MRQSEVMPTLRLHKQHPLWNYEVSKWSESQIKEFKMLRDGIEKPVPEKRGYVKTGTMARKKVRRISDNKPYESITDCAKDNGVSNCCISTHVNRIVKIPKYVWL